jgi:hypothetical protein
LEDTYRQLIEILLPAGTLDYIDLAHVYKDRESLNIYLEEKNLPPQEYKDEVLHSKGFIPEVKISDFPIRKHKVTLCIKRRLTTKTAIQPSYQNQGWQGRKPFV